MRAVEHWPASASRAARAAEAEREESLERTSRPATDPGVLRALERALDGRVSARPEDRVCYAFDATDIRSWPEVVAWPASTEEVAAVVTLAGEHGLPVVPRGAGTGYTGGSVPVCGGVVVSFEKMNRVLSIDARRRLAVVEPGVVNNDLRLAAERLGLTYPPDPASLLVSTVGGNVAEGAGGPRTVMHGTTRDYVVGLEFVLMDGSVLSTGVLAQAPGATWDPGPIIVGSEGTLAVVTKIAVRLTSLPESFATYWVEFPSLENAARAVSEITATGLPVSVLEILDRGTLACALEYARGALVEDVPTGSLLVELEGERDALGGAADGLRRIVETHSATVFREAVDEEEREKIWEIRRSISPSLARLSTGKINEDIAVPRSAIPAFVRSMQEISDAVELPIHAFGHAGDGNLHVNIIVDRADERQMQAARRAVGKLFTAALEMGGTLSGEHGIGITKAEHLSMELGPSAMRTATAVKLSFDPARLLNPDKILTGRPNPWWDNIPPCEAARNSGAHAC